ncbi:MAG: hypothetical protein ACI4QV_00050 [Acutalibacteraceae bacterium]
MGVPVHNSVINNFTIYRYMSSIGITGTQIERLFLNYDRQDFDLTIYKSGSNWNLCDTFWYGQSKGDSCYTANVVDDINTNNCIYVNEISFKKNPSEDRGFADAVLCEWLRKLPCTVSVLNNSAITAEVDKSNARIKINFNDYIPTDNTTIRILLSV